MVTTIAYINPDILSWARERAQLSPSALATKLKIAEDKLYLWESGEKTLTFRQAQTFANKTFIPFGYLFLKERPEDKLPLPDLRTVGGENPNTYSTELIDIIKIMMNRQIWFQEYLLEQGIDNNPLVGRFNVSNSVEEIVQDIREVLSVEKHPTRGNWEDYYRELVKKIEGSGIMVVRESFVHHYTRPLKVSEFRGFAIADKSAPLIFINHADVETARLFTLIHELSHIWLGASGISDGSARNERKEEILCNAVAAEFLVPSDEFQTKWRDDWENWRENLAPCEAHFHVSSWVIARRALTLKKIGHQEYQKYIKEQEDTYAKRQKSNGAPSYYKTKKAHISNQFAEAVVSEALSQRLLLRDAGLLLDLKPNRIESFAGELGI